jgi:arginine decarboxylase
VFDIDPLRIVIDTRVGGISGHDALQLLWREHPVHFEVATESVIVAVIGAGAVPDVQRVLDALHALPEQDVAESSLSMLTQAGPAVMTLRDAYSRPPSWFSTPSRRSHLG